jgi:hypothetical protein
LANEPLDDAIPEMVKIDIAPTLVTSIWLSAQKCLGGLPLLDRLHPLLKKL